ncbi:hypothetical protein KI387_008111, partial [Taxus chinensis]
NQLERKKESALTLIEKEHIEEKKSDLEKLNKDDIIEIFLLSFGEYDLIDDSMMEEDIQEDLAVQKRPLEKLVEEFDLSYFMLEEEFIQEHCGLQ